MFENLSVKELEALKKMIAESIAYRGSVNSFERQVFDKFSENLEQEIFSEGVYELLEECPLEDDRPSKYSVDHHSV